MTIAERLKIARELTGFSQTEAGTRSGVGQKEISLLEKGTRKFIPNQYMQFLQKEGIDINSLFDDSKQVGLNRQLPPENIDQAHDHEVIYSKYPVTQNTNKQQKGVTPTVTAKTILLPQIIYTHLV